LSLTVGSGFTHESEKSFIRANALAYFRLNVVDGEKKDLNDRHQINATIKYVSSDPGYVAATTTGPNVIILLNP
jgi:hypothetical protein